MKIGVFGKLFASFLFAGTLLAVAMVAMTRYSFEKGFSAYLQDQEVSRLDKLVRILESAYAEHGDWRFIDHNPPRWHEYLNSALGENSFPPGWGGPPEERGTADGRPPPEGAPERPRDPDRIAGPPPRRPGPGGPGANSDRPPPPLGADPLALGPRLRLLDIDHHPLIGRGDPPPEARLIPLRAGGQIVGWLSVRPTRLETDKIALRFFEEQTLSFYFIALGALLISALASLVLARSLVIPVKRLAEAARNLAAGAFDTRVPPAGQDEIGALTRDFNQLAETLERNENARRTWIADISHELRTPLAILQGEIEAMQDGVRPTNEAGLQSLHRQTLGLAKLANDLHHLALSDLGALAYRKRDIDLGELVGDVAAESSKRFLERGLELKAQVPDEALILHADADRLRQLFGNLLENSLRYTDAGGKLSISLRRQDKQALLEFADTAPGVPDESLAQLFDRLYRVDKSRARAQGGSGLGLAICRNIVEAHGGTISAHHASQGGVLIRIALPLDER